MLLRVDRAAICGTDLHPYHGRMEIEEGFVLGHEYLGTIEAKGDGVTQFEEGDRAVGSFFVSCGNCWFCRRGVFMKCVGIRVFGHGDGVGRPARRPGAVHARARGRPDPAQDPRGTASSDEDMLFVGDILTTGYDAVRKTDMRPGDVVAVVGCGPGRALHGDGGPGARRRHACVAVDMVPERLKLAESLGAIAGEPEGGGRRRRRARLTEWRGADVVVDAVGHESALAATFPLVRMGGTISLPGMYVEDRPRCRSATCG